MDDFHFRQLLIYVILIVAFEAVATESKSFGFGALFDNLHGTVEEMMEKANGAMGETIQRASILSSIFGSDIKRGDLTLPQIVSGVFSRNNPIIVSDSFSNDDGFVLSDGSSFIAAASNGGAMSVASKNGTVTISTATSPPQNIHVGPHPSRYPDHADDKSFESGIDVSETAEPDEQSLKPGQHGSDNESEISEKEEKADETFIELMSNWETYVLSSIWDEQDVQRDVRVASREQQDAKVESVSLRVVNGVFLENRMATGAPFSVRFFFDDERNFYCSGSLISYSHVLTAAHCGIVVGDSVRIGGRLLRSGLNGTVSSVFIHPSFKSHSLAYDIAVVVLDGLPASLFEGMIIIPAKLNKRKSVPRSNFVGVVSAHGATKTDGSGISHVILSTRQRVLKLVDCQQEIQQGKVKNDGSFVCVGDGIRSTTCVGDSGAGLWHVRSKVDKKGRKRWFYEVVAVVSFGEVTDDALCPTGKPAVFQRTATSYNWIKTVINSSLTSRTQN